MMVDFTSLLKPKAPPQGQDDKIVQASPEFVAAHKEVMKATGAIVTNDADVLANLSIDDSATTKPITASTSTEDWNAVLSSKMEKPVTIESNLTTAQLQEMIAQLSVTEEGESLVTAMDNLKMALRANPAACANFLPEDIGEMVKHLRRLTGKDIEEQLARKRKTKEPKLDFSKMTAEDKQEIIDDLNF